jgi:acyl-coenzyme A synthetase/AMP-(fatty) acid ligase
VLAQEVATAGVPFARGLSAFGSRLAVVTSDGGELSYAELAARVEDARQRLGTGRRLVLVAATNDLDPLVTYLAALAGRHPVLLTGPDDRHREELIETYDPDVVLGRDGLWERHAGSVHAPHPDLAVLLSTSGSTGSPKLVRLSAHNLQANAESIASYLDIRDTDRAAATLPMHYCYGLSVINSNLLRGAGLLLSNDSVVEERFWTRFTGHGGTSLHGVPYTFDLLERIGFDGLRLPSLRYVTQAGGRLDPERVRELARQGERDGWRLFVMYGQTEATARMAYLPPELAASHPATVGVPIPGGSFEILPSEVPDQGELVYRGPNVMLGYAESPADLALGRTVEALPTGDIARRTGDGLYELVGRAARFVKICGLRIDPRHVEQVLAGLGHRVACTGSGDLLVVASESAGVSPKLVGEHVGLPASRVRVARVGELPRLPTGKVDYPAVAALAHAAPPPAAGSIRDRYAAVLHLTAVPAGASFVDLGGDSLSYVRMSIEIERILGHVPDGWHLTPVGELERLTPRRRVRTSTVETNIVLRAAAIVLIVGTHVGFITVLGGAHLLLIVSGWMFARFCLAPNGSSRGILRTAMRIAVPSSLVLVERMMFGTNIGLPNVLLVNNYVRTGAQGYWYVEVLVQVLLLCAVALAVPAIRNLERRHGFAFALVVLTGALLVNLLAVDRVALPERVMATHGVVWLFALGWLAHRSVLGWQKLLVTGIAVLTVPGYFGDPVRESIVLFGLVALLFVPRLVLPRSVMLLVGPVASASLYIYLTHYGILQWAIPAVNRGLVMVMCLAFGVLVWWLAGLPRVRYVLPRTALPRRPRGGRHHDAAARPETRPDLQQVQCHG